MTRKNDRITYFEEQKRTPDLSQKQQTFKPNTRTKSERSKSIPTFSQRKTIQTTNSVNNSRTIDFHKQYKDLDMDYILERKVKHKSIDNSNHSKIQSLKTNL